MAILDYSAQIWREALDLPQDDEPVALILEGTWWRKDATRNRLALLDEVRELPFPEMYLGYWQGHKVAYCCAYGAARAVEPAHIFAQLGTRLLIQIGTCGSLDENAPTGMIVLPERCAARDGIAQAYGAGKTVTTDPQWLTRAEKLLGEAGAQTKRTYHLTWPSLFAQSAQMCDDWAEEGLASIDMETSAVTAVANHFGAGAIAMLTVWDVLFRGRTFLDPLDPAEQKLLKKSNEQVFITALQLAKVAGESNP